MFVVGQGWLTAEEVAPGDAIRNADLRELTVLAVEVDDRPQRVHNLEIAEAHTYFAGELEAWGHNSGRKKIRNAAIGAVMNFGAMCGPVINDFANPTSGTNAMSGSGGPPQIGGSIDPNLPPKTPGPKLGPADRDKKRRRCTGGTRRR